jgi:hypothetical protein
MILTGETGVLGENPVAGSLRPPQISYGFDRARPRASVASSRRLKFLTSVQEFGSNRSQHTPLRAHSAQSTHRSQHTPLRAHTAHSTHRSEHTPLHSMKESQFMLFRQITTLCSEQYAEHRETVRAKFSVPNVTAGGTHSYRRHCNC